MVNGSVDASPRTTCCRDGDGSTLWDEVSVYSWVKCLVLETGHGEIHLFQTDACTSSKYMYLQTV